MATVGSSVPVHPLFQNVTIIFQPMNSNTTFTTEKMLVQAVHVQ